MLLEGKWNSALKKDWEGKDGQLEKMGICYLPIQRTRTLSSGKPKLCNNCHNLKGLLYFSFDECR